MEGVTECACAFARVHAVRVGAWDWRIAGRRLLSSETVGVMQGRGHRGGFSVHAGERVAAQDRVGRCSCAYHDEAVTSNKSFL